MKGSSSARLPALNVCCLVASPCANSCWKKKKKEKTETAKGKTEKKTHMPGIDRESIERNQQESGNISTGYTNATKRKLKLTVFLPDDNEERKMAQFEAHFRRKGKTYRDNRLIGESSVISLKQRRLLSARSRGHLLSLMPTKDASGSFGKCIDQDLVNSAKRELDSIRKHHGDRRPSRRESGEINTLFKQSKKASRLNKVMFGMHNQTNNSLEAVDHVIDSKSRRAYFMAPMSANKLPQAVTHNSKWDEGQKEIRAYFQEALRKNTSNDAEENALNVPSTERTANKKNTDTVKYDFYV